MHNLALGLSVAPFDPEFDPRFFYRGFQHSAALSFLGRAVEAEEAIVALSGTDGTGKSATVSFFVEDSDRKVRGARLTEIPGEGPRFLRAVLSAFGFGTIDAQEGELKSLLSVFLVQIQQDGQHADLTGGC